MRVIEKNLDRLMCSLRHPLHVSREFALPIADSFRGPIGQARTALFIVWGQKSRCPPGNDLFEKSGGETGGEAVGLAERRTTSRPCR